MRLPWALTAFRDFVLEFAPEYLEKPADRGQSATGASRREDYRHMTTPLLRRLLHGSS
jgi:hypothetical protein